MDIMFLTKTNPNLNQQSILTLKLPEELVNCGNIDAESCVGYNIVRNWLSVNPEPKAARLYIGGNCNAVSKEKPTPHSGAFPESRLRISRHALLGMEQQA